MRNLGHARLERRLRLLNVFGCPIHEVLSTHPIRSRLPFELTARGSIYSLPRSPLRHDPPFHQSSVEEEGEGEEAVAMPAHEGGPQFL